MAALAFSSFVALAALAGFVLAVAWVRHSPPVGLALVCLAIIPLWERPALFRSPIIELAGARLYILDVATLVLFAAGMMQVRQLRTNLRGWLFAWVLLGVVIAAALLRASAVDGLAAGVNSARLSLYFFWAMTWVMGVRPDRLRLRTVSLVLGWALVLVALYHGVTHGFGGAVSRISTGDDFVQTGRVHVGQQSIALLLCAATVFWGDPSGSANSRPRFDAVSALVFVGVVVIAQNRSVWAAGVLGMAGVLIVSARRRARQQIFIQLAVGAGVALVAWNSGILSGSAISESASSTSTYEWRSYSWQILISQAIARGPESVMFGEPSANTYLRQMKPDQTTSLSAHNWYVDTFLYLGLIGLILLVTLLISALVRSRDKPAFGTFVLVAVAAYGWAYSVEWYAAPWLGAAIVVSLGACRVAEDPVQNSGLEVTRQAATARQVVNGQVVNA